MPEFALFVIVGFIAVFASASMLLTKNAVYSALFLIVTMVCIAFFFILLDAPFLAMVQVTVYAGAIMVLFVFVIMLLGAESLTIGRPVFRWQPGMALALVLALLVIGGIVITRGNLDTQEPVPTNPLVRVVHSASDIGAVSVMIGGEAVSDDTLSFRDATDFVTVPAGEAEITLRTEDGTLLGLDPKPVLDSDTAQSVVVYGEDQSLAFSVVPVVEETAPPGNEILSVMNAYTGEETLTLVDLGINDRLDLDELGNIADPVLVEAIEPGGVSEPVLARAGVARWALVRPNGEILLSMRDFKIEGGGVGMMLISAERTFDDGLRAVVEPIYLQEETPGFGSPTLIGRDLFTRYMLVFQMVALLLLGAMIGAIMLTHPDGVPARDRPGGRRRVSQPLTSVISSQIEHEVTTSGSGDSPALPGQAAGD
jgi:NADH:ubiquinone oxidoreductase subunit 6 (subunit J)